MANTSETFPSRSKQITGKRSQRTLERHSAQHQGDCEHFFLLLNLANLCRLTESKSRPKARPAGVPKAMPIWAGPDVELEPDSDDEDVEQVPSILLSDIGENTGKSMLQYFNAYDPISAVIRQTHHESGDKELILQFASTKMRDVVTFQHV